MEERDVMARLLKSIQLKKEMRAPVDDEGNLLRRRSD
jgi:hypothetical protein